MHVSGYCRSAAGICSGGTGDSEGGCFISNLKLKRTPGIYFVGFMACGKSTIARWYAEEIGWRFADLDEDIEARQKMTIRDIFTNFGEEEFRRIESEAMRYRVQMVRRGSPTVLAL